MIHEIVCLRDIVADVYHPPMFAPNLGSAIRSFGDACLGKPEGNQVSQHPEDYELYHLGTFDDQHATFKIATQKQIALGRNYKA